MLRKHKNKRYPSSFEMVVLVDLPFVFVIVTKGE